MFNIVRSKLPDFSLQMNSSRSRPRQLQLSRSTSEETPEIRKSRSPGCQTGYVEVWQPGDQDSSIEGFSVTSALWRLKERGFTPDKYTHQIYGLLSLPSFLLSKGAMALFCNNYGCHDQLSISPISCFSFAAKLLTLLRHSSETQANPVYNTETAKRCQVMASIDIYMVLN